jgi:hypothetical protein
MNYRAKKMKQTLLLGITLLGCATAFVGCAATVDEGYETTEDTGSTSQELTAGHDYLANVTGGIAIKRKVVFTETITAPRIRSGLVSFGPNPPSCTTRSDGVQECLYTMAWKGVKVDDFSANGHTLRALNIDTYAPVPVKVAQGKFTIPANTARFNIRGTDNGSAFHSVRYMDSEMSGTFTPGGAFTLNGVITRHVSGPLGINVRVWGNVALSGTMVDTTPTCSSTGSGTFACDPGARPAGNCQATTLHRFVFSCNGLTRADQAIDLLATGYGNYTCSNRFTDQCIGDGSFDSYYLEWCNYKCSP